MSALTRAADRRVAELLAQLVEVDEVRFAEHLQRLEDRLAHRIGKAAE